MAISLTGRQPQLCQQLLQVALDVGVKVHSGVKIESVDVAGTAVLLADGEKISVDLIIGADGLHVGDTLVKNLPLYHCLVECSSVRCQIPRPRQQEVLTPAVNWSERNPVHAPQIRRAERQYHVHCC